MDRCTLEGGVVSCSQHVLFIFMIVVMIFFTVFIGISTALSIGVLLTLLVICSIKKKRNNVVNLQYSLHSFNENLLLPYLLKITVLITLLLL